MRESAPITGSARDADGSGHPLPVLRTQLYDRGVPVPEDRLTLLLGRAMPVEEPASAVICRCNAVTRDQVVDAYRGGATTMSELATATRATTGGGCADAVRQIVDSGKDPA